MAVAAPTRVMMNPVAIPVLYARAYSSAWRFPCTASSMSPPRMPPAGGPRLLHLGWRVSADRGRVGVRGSWREPTAGLPLGLDGSGDRQSVRDLRVLLPERFGDVQRRVERSVCRHADPGSRAMGPARLGGRGRSVEPRFAGQVRKSLRGLYEFYKRGAGVYGRPLLCRSALLAVPVVPRRRLPRDPQRQRWRAVREDSVAFTPTRAPSRRDPTTGRGASRIPFRSRSAPPSRRS
jgi:hypothetical protein